MRQCRGHFAEGGEPRHMKQLLLLLLHPGFRSVAFSQVAAEAGEEATRSRMHFTDGEFHRKRRSVLAHSGYRAP